MFNKLYAKVKNYIKEEWKNLITISVLLVITLYQFPYYINATGGLLDASDRVEIANSNKMEGSLHMAYVNEIPATIPVMFMSLFNKSWDIIPKEEVVYVNETEEEAFERGKIYLESTLANATLYAFDSANKETTVSNKRTAILYKTEDANTTLLVGDVITKVNNVKVDSFESIGIELEKYDANETINIGVLDSKGKNKTRTATLTKEGKIGIILQTLFDIKTKPAVKFKFKKREAGPSGGLITTLMIYNMLTDTDVTNGLKVAGTGTIEADGTIGEIGGIKQKLAGVVKEKADVFLCPIGNNYDDAINIKKEFGYDIKIIGVSTFEDALLKLNKMTIKKEV